jgi:hypothetical protein
MASPMLWLGAKPGLRRFPQCTPGSCSRRPARPCQQPAFSGRKLPRRLGFGVGLHGAMQPAHPPIGVATGRDRELPHARADLGLRSRASWSSPPPGRRGSPRKERCSTRTHAWSSGQALTTTPAASAPRANSHVTRRAEGLCHRPSASPRRPGPRPRPGVVLARTIDLRLETVPQALTQRTSPTCRGVSERCNGRCKAPQVQGLDSLHLAGGPGRPWSGF